MKHIFPLGLMALLTIGCTSINPAISTQKVNLPEAAAPTSIAQSTSSPNPAARRQTPQREMSIAVPDLALGLDIPMVTLSIIARKIRNLNLVNPCKER
jgi:hypothetical protein